MTNPPESIEVSFEDLAAFYKCGRKLAYDSVEAAATNARRVFELNGLELIVYPCPFGEHFHVGKEHVSDRPTTRRELAKTWRRSGGKAETWLANRKLLAV